MSHNLVARSKEKCDKVNVDLAALGLNYQKRTFMSVVNMESMMQHYRIVA